MGSQLSGKAYSLCVKGFRSNSAIFTLKTVRDIKYEEDFAMEIYKWGKAEAEDNIHMIMQSCKCCELCLYCNGGCIYWNFASLLFAAELNGFFTAGNPGELLPTIPAYTDK